MKERERERERERESESERGQRQRKRNKKRKGGEKREKEYERERERETERGYRDYNNIGKYVHYLKIQRTQEKYDKPVECNLYKCWNFHPCSATNKIASRM